MPDTMTPKQRHDCMSHIRATNTGPEILLRQALWHSGFRYRTNDKQLPGTPDIVFPKYHTVVFIHGCFWHGHKGCKLYTVPKSNTDFWTAKIARNQEHDQNVWRQLEAKGWNVIIVWECELKNGYFHETVTSVEAQLRANHSRVLQEKLDRRARRKEWYDELKRRKERTDLLLKGK